MTTVFTARCWHCCAGRRAARGHRVTVCAPALPQSAKSHALTVHSPLCARSATMEGSAAAWQVEGTPADCTRLGLRALAQEPVDLVISGINDGWNLGLLTYVSGTVAAARRPPSWGIPPWRSPPVWTRRRKPSASWPSGPCAWGNRFPPPIFPRKPWSMSTYPPAPSPAARPTGYAPSPPYMTARLRPLGQRPGQLLRQRQPGTEHGRPGPPQRRRADPAGSHHRQPGKPPPPGCIPVEPRCWMKCEKMKV